MEWKHLVITCTLTMKGKEIPTMHALIDCGATGIVFMDQDFVRHHRRGLQERKHKWYVQMIDGRLIRSGDITHIANVGSKIQDHGEQLPMWITKLGHHPIVPWIPWLRFHDVAVRSESIIVTFGSQYCITHCQDVPVTVRGVTEEPPEPVSQIQNIFEPQIRPSRLFWGNIAFLNGVSFFREVQKGQLTVY
jgi:hypothetical protein